MKKLRDEPKVLKSEKRTFKNISDLSH